MQTIQVVNSNKPVNKAMTVNYFYFNLQNYHIFKIKSPT